MILINEWLPNPVGADGVGEWIELKNDGTKVDLTGWSLATKARKKVFLQGHIEAGGYLVLKRSQTHIALKNKDEALLLYNSHGQLVDHSEFSFAAPTGKSFSRQGTIFLFSQPSPGVENPEADTSLIDHSYPLNQPLNSAVGTFALTTILIVSSLCIAVAILFVIKRSDELSHLLFARN